MPLLQNEIVKITGLSQEDAREKLWEKADKRNYNYLSALKANAVSPGTWAAVTLCYETNNPEELANRIRED